MNTDRKPAVLVVDDNYGNRHLATILLKPEGFLVATASSRAAALEALARQPFDLIVADIRMPGGGGFELYEELRGTAHANTPMVLMSATLTPDDLKRGANLPGLRLVERPLDGDIFVAAIRDALPKP